MVFEATVLAGTLAVSDRCMGYPRRCPFLAQKDCERDLKFSAAARHPGSSGGNSPSLLLASAAVSHGPPPETPPDARRRIRCIAAAMTWPATRCGTPGDAPCRGHRAPPAEMPAHRCHSARWVVCLIASIDLRCGPAATWPARCPPRRTAVD